MRTYARPTLTPLGSVFSITKSKSLPLPSGSIPGLKALPVLIEYPPT